MAFAGQSQAALTDGVYETTVNGHNAPMTVKVTIKDHKIAAIDASKTWKVSASVKLLWTKQSRRNIKRPNYWCRQYYRRFPLKPRT